MSKYFSRLHSRARKNPFHFASRIMPTHRTARLLVPAFVVIMGIGYVVIGNLTTAKAYELRRVESSLVELRAENRRLELEVVKSTAAQSVASEVQNLGLVPTSNVAYLESGGAQVARK